MKLPVIAGDPGWASDVDLLMLGCFVVDGRRYVEFELIRHGRKEVERINSRMPLDILMRWETLRDRAVLQMLEGG